LNVITNVDEALAVIKSVITAAAAITSYPDANG